MHFISICNFTQVLGPGPPPGNNPTYWTACASYFTYFALRVATGDNTVRSIGASQLMDAPGQEPSVTLLDWSTGLGTARLWSLALLLDAISVGDAFVSTKVAVNGNMQPNTYASSAFYAQAWIAGPSSRAPVTMSRSGPTGAPHATLLVLNKMNAVGTVSLKAAAGTSTTCTAYIIDDATGLGPARIEDCADNFTLTLQPFANAVVDFGPLQL